MNLLVYSHLFPPSIGGVETIVLALAKGLAEHQEKRFKVTVVTQTRGSSFADESLTFSVVRRPGAVRLWKLIASSDLVHVSGPALLPMFFALLARKPLVIEHHGFQAVCPNGQLLIETSCTPCPGHFMAGRHMLCLRCNSPQGRLVSFRLWLLTFVRRFLSRSASANIAPTAWLGSLLRLSGTTAIPHGVAAPLSRARTASSAAPVIAFQGRLVSTKGAKLLLDAARILRAQNRTFELLIIGDGPEREKLQEIARQYNLADCVRFLGRVPQDQLEATLSQVDAVVLPSLGGEVFGLVLLENMARSLPIIASDLGAFTEVLGNAGLIFRTGEAGDLAAQIAKLLTNPSLASQLAQRAHQRATELYSMNHMIEAHARLYADLVKQAGR